MAKHDYRSFYEKDYLGAWNIPESGELTLTIAKCVQGELNNPGTKKTTKKPVVFLKETDKKLALNVTNGKTIASMYGNIVEAWPGKRITLYKSMTRNPGGGDDVECLRIRPTVPKESAPAAVTSASSDLSPAEPGDGGGDGPDDAKIIADVDAFIAKRKFGKAEETASLISDPTKREAAIAKIAQEYVRAKEG